jgi:hypothetical protein
LTGTVFVFAEQGCTFTASSTDPWINVTANSATGIVSYFVGANASASPRTGNITIAGQPFTVTQFGAAKRRAVGR